MCTSGHTLRAATMGATVRLSAVQRFRMGCIISEMEQIHAELVEKTARGKERRP